MRSRLVSQLGQFGHDSIEVRSGHGSTLTCTDGTSYLDASAGYWNVSLGYSDPALRAAVSSAVACLPAAHLYRRLHEPASSLAETFHEVFPDVTERVLLANDGSGAVETALRLAVESHHWRTGRRPSRLLVLDGAFHGDSITCRELGGFPARGLTASFRGLDVVRLPREQPANLGMWFEGGDVAAVLVEPVQGWGFHVIAPGYLSNLAQLSWASGGLFIVDEVATGLGRTGQMLAIERSGVRPDLVVLGKGLTSGWAPLAAVLAGPRPAAWLRGRAFEHGRTTAGHPIACAVAEATVRAIVDRDLCAAATAMGAQFRARMAASARRYGLQIRGEGAMLAVDLKQTALAAEARDAARCSGVLVGQEGPTITFCPPLTTPPVEVSLMVDAYHHATLQVFASKD